MTRATTRSGVQDEDARLAELAQCGEPVYPDPAGLLDVDQEPDLARATGDAFDLYLP